MNSLPKIPQFEGQELQLSNSTQRHPWKNLIDLRKASQETSLINLLENVTQICKSVLFEMSLRHCMRRLKNISMLAGKDIYCKIIIKYDKLNTGTTSDRKMKLPS